MKVEVEDQVKEFKPIKLTITIETEEELCSLWHRLNAAKDTFSKDSGSHYLKHGVISDYVLWHRLEELVNVNNLNK
tara:strand:- start:369 stop:596 length:228 start_codon:yes stop_codon:yes gene_type:complete